MTAEASAWWLAWIVLSVAALLGAMLVLAAVAAHYRGPYRRDDDLSDTRPERPS